MKEILLSILSVFVIQTVALTIEDQLTALDQKLTILGSCCCKNNSNNSYFTTTMAPPVTSTIGPTYGYLQQVLRGHRGEVYGFAVLLNGSLASASMDLTIKIWNASIGVNTITLLGHTNRVYGLATFPNGYLASCSWDMTVRIWNPNSGSLVKTLIG